jgi:hypothetical protein
MSFKQQIIFRLNPLIITILKFILTKIYQTSELHFLIRRFPSRRSGSRVGIPERDRDSRTLVPTINKN